MLCGLTHLIQQYDRQLLLEAHASTVDLLLGESDSFNSIHATICDTLCQYCICVPCTFHVSSYYSL